MYEAKSFTGRMDSGAAWRWEWSLVSAARHQPDHWDLLAPIDPTPAEQQWFDGLRGTFPFVRGWRRSRPRTRSSRPIPSGALCAAGVPEYLLERIAEAGAGRGGLAGGIGDYLRVDRHAAGPGAGCGELLRLGLVPDASGAFVERESQEALAQALQRADGDASGPSAAVPVRGRVITGTGGAGKTSLAAWYCHAADGDAAHGVDVLLWVTAHSALDVACAHAQAAGDAGAGARWRGHRVVACQFLNWLRTTERRWLIVLDDVRSPGVMEGLWPPQHTAVTAGSS